jgi:hypothetical protein
MNTFVETRALNRVRQMAARHRRDTNQTPLDFGNQSYGNVPWHTQGLQTFLGIPEPIVPGPTDGQITALNNLRYCGEIPTTFEGCRALLKGLNQTLRRQT